MRLRGSASRRRTRLTLRVPQSARGSAGFYQVEQSARPGNSFRSIHSANDEDGSVKAGLAAAADGVPFEAVANGSQSFGRHNRGSGASVTTAGSGGANGEESVHGCAPSRAARRIESSATRCHCSRAERGPLQGGSFAAHPPPPGCAGL